MENLSRIFGTALLIVTGGLFVAAAVAAAMGKRAMGLLVRAGLALALVFMLWGILVPTVFRKTTENPFTPEEATAVALAGGFRALSDAIRQHYPSNAPIPSADELEQAVIAVTRKWTADQKHKMRLDSEGRILDGWRRPLRIACPADGGAFFYSVGPNGKDEHGSGDDIRWGR